MAQKKQQASPPPRLALIVLGMHRSGTSALAGVLARMGADLPQNLISADEFNPDGYFESPQIYELNDALLGSAGSSWDDWHAVNADWYDTPRKREYARRAQEILTQEFGASRFFVLKDPRICRLVPFWSEGMAEADIEPLFICTHRNPIEVAASLARRNGFPESRGLLLWLRYILDAEADSRGCKRAFVSYDGLLADWRGTIDRIGEDLGLLWPIRPETAAAGIEGFLSGTRRNFRAAEMEDQPDSTVSGWIGDVHEILERWVRDGETPDDHQRLDNIRAALRETDATLSLLTRETGRESELARRLQSETELSQAKISELEAALRAAREDAASHAANHAAEQLARADTQTRINELEEALRTAREDAETELRNRIAAEESRYRALAQSHDALEAKHDALENTLEQAEHERDQLRSQLEQSRSEAGDFHRQTLSDARRIAELEARLKDLETERVALKRKSERETRQLAAMKQQLAMRFSREIELRLDGASARDHDQERQSLLSEGAAERDRIEQARRAAEARTAELQAALQAARAEAEQLQTNNANERLAREMAETWTAELDAALKAVRAEAEQLQASSTSERQARETAEARIAELEAAFNAARAEADQMLRSKSWRITAPLRYLMEKIHGK